MKHASDEQVALITRHAPWTSDRDEQARHREAVKCVLAELIALRKVAEAAKQFIATMENYTKATHWLFEIDEALKEAGYDA